MRRGGVEFFRTAVGGSYRRIGRGIGGHARGFADIRAYRYTRVIPDAHGFGDTYAFRGR